MNEQAFRAELEALIVDPAVPPARISDFFDGLPPDVRVRVTRTLGRRTQIALWRKVESFRELGLDHFVPEGRPAFSPTRHYGRNTMPTFVIFEKRFYRLGEGDAIAGANFQHISPITGPGYFVATEDRNTREVLIDYRSVPETAPDGWPRVKSNEVGMSRFIYGFMVDRMRRVSKDVTIGRANRRGKDFDAWFLLCREQLS